MRSGDWAIGKIEEVDRIFLSSTSYLTDRSILAVLLVLFSADIVPRQLVAVEVDPASYDILSSELDHISFLEEPRKRNSPVGVAA
jgi:hypothetical protein